MLEISSNGIITFNRGDTWELPLFINLSDRMDSLRYELTDNDTIYLGVMEFNQPWELAIIRKKYTKANLNSNGDIIINFTSTDSEYLHPGTYYYEIKLNTITRDSITGTELTNETKTLVSKKKLIIL